MNFKKMPSGYGMVQTDAFKLNISIQSKAIYAYLCSRTGSNDYCWPSIQTISNDISLSKPMVIKYLQELEAIGLIIKSRLYPNDPLKNNHKYEVMIIENDTKVKSNDERKLSTINLASKADLIDNNNIINNNITTSSEAEVKKSKTRTPDAQKDYDNRDLFIEHLKTKHNYEIIPDNSFNKMFFPKLKQYGIDKLLLVIDNYFADVKENGKFAGTMDSVFYQPLRFAKYANMNKQETTNDEERVKAILATRKQFEGLNDTRKR